VTTDSVTLLCPMFLHGRISLTEAISLILNWSKLKLVIKTFCRQPKTFLLQSAYVHRGNRQMMVLWCALGRQLSGRNVNKSVLSLLRRLSTQRYPHVLLSAGACSTAPAANDRHQLQTQANSSTLGGHRCCCRSMGQTDGRTDDRQLHRPCSVYYAGSVNNSVLVLPLLSASFVITSNKLPSLRI